MTEHFDSQLVEKAKHDSGAFAELYDYFFPRVYAFVMAKVRDKSVAEDIVSDVFMKLLENLHKFEDRGMPFAAWLFTVTRNVLFDYYAKSQKNYSVTLDESIEIKDDKKDSSPLIMAQESELKESVAEVMAKLPEKELSVIQLKFFSGLNNREIAATLDLSETNVGVILYRVLRKIKPDLNNLF